MVLRLPTEPNLGGVPGQIEVIQNQTPGLDANTGSPSPPTTDNPTASGTHNLKPSAPASTQKQVGSKSAVPLQNDDNQNQTPTKTK